MKIDCTKTINNLKGVPFIDEEKKPITIGQQISNLLLTEKTGFDVSKAYNLGIRFYNEKEIELDIPDLDKIKEAITNSQFITVLVKGRILDELKVVGEK